MRKKWITVMVTFTIIMGIGFVTPAIADFVNFGGFGAGDKDWTTDDIGARYAKDWTKEQVKEFVNRPWTQKEKDTLLGSSDMGYILDKKSFPMKRVAGKDLTPKQLYMNGKSYWMPIMLQYGCGMNMKLFKKLWIDEGKWKDPKHILLDIRMESEFLQGHIPGAIRVDTGLDMWHLPALKLPGDATYYIQCKSGAPADGGIRGALVARRMRIMGYSGNIYNLTDGFRGWLELGYPVINRHGQFKLVPGTFQKPDPMLKVHPKTLKYSPQP